MFAPCSSRPVADPPALRHRSARKFDKVLHAQGLVGRVVELPDSTRTAADAARSIGCELRQIVKSLVFEAGPSRGPVLVLASGANRVDEEWMARYVGARLERAHPETARSVTGYAIGGVPPSGHATPIPTFIDLDLLEHTEVWAAAGHPNAVCRLDSKELLTLSRGRPVPVTPSGDAEGRSAPWITFDCYGTLVDWREGFLQVADRLGFAKTAAERQRLFHHYLEVEPACEAPPYRRYRDVMADALIRAGRSMGLEISTDAARLLPESVPEWPVFPDVAASFESLRQGGLRLGILSNIDRDLIDRALARNGMRIDRVITSEDVRSYKPAPPHWARFLKESGASPESVVHASGSYEYDLETAKLFGLRTVYVSRYGPPPPGRQIDAIVQGLQDLVGSKLLTTAFNGSGPAAG